MIQAIAFLFCPESREGFSSLRTCSSFPLQTACFFRKCYCAFLHSWFNAIFFDCTLFFLVEKCWHFLWEGWELKLVVWGSGINVSYLLLRRSVSSKTRVLLEFIVWIPLLFESLKYCMYVSSCEFLNMFYLLHSAVLKNGNRSKTFSTDPLGDINSTVTHTYFQNNVIC